MNPKIKKYKSEYSNRVDKTPTKSEQESCGTTCDSYSEDASSNTNKPSTNSTHCSGATRTIHRTPPDSCESRCMFNCEDIETGTMRTALESIAQEMQKFYTSGTEYIESNRDQENIFKKLTAIRSTLVKKNSLIRRLKSNLKIACSLAQSVWSSKDSESAQLSNRLQRARSEATMLLTVDKQRSSMMKQVKDETKMLRERVDALQSFIQRTYKVLQQIKGEAYKDVPVIQQLREIIVSCGQYYADYANQHTQLVQLEQTNRFLMSKIKILESNLAASNPRNDNARRPKTQKTSSALLCEYSKTAKCFVSLEDRTADKSEYGMLSSHFKLVRNILDDQALMLKDLKDLALELNNESCIC